MISFAADPVPDDGASSWLPVPEFVAGDSAQFFFLVRYHQEEPANAGACLCKLRWTDPGETVRTFEPGGAGTELRNHFIADVKAGTGIEYLIEDYSSYDVGLHDMTVNLQIAALGNW